MSFGLSDTGFNTKRLQDIKSDLEAALRAAFGEVDVSAASVFGQLNGVYSRPAADLWELAELVYHSQSPNSAEGVPLDEVVAYTGLERRPASKGRVLATLYTEDTGSLPVSIPAVSGSQPTSFGVVSTGDEFQMVQDTDITDTAVVDSTVEVTGAVDGKTYTVTINGTGFDYLATAVDTVDTIADQLKDAINAGAEPVSADTTGLASGRFRVLADDAQTPTTFTLAVSEDGVGTNIELFEVGSPSECQAAEAGVIVAPLGTLTDIVTPRTGLDRVDNLVDGIPGAEDETDAELRLRREQSLTVIGSGTLAAIRSRILDDVDGVSAVSIFENREGVTDPLTGMPSHSFWCVVSGGLDQDIGQMIWDTKPAGIQTYGGVTPVDVTVIDTNGDPQHVYFSRPVDRYAWVKARYEVYSEEAYPGSVTAIQAIKDALLAFGDEFRIGEDMLRDRFYAPITNAVAGIGNVPTLEIALEANPGDPPVYVTDEKPVAPNEIAVFAELRLDIDEAP